MCGIDNSCDYNIKSSSEFFSGTLFGMLFRAVAKSISFCLITWSRSCVRKSCHKRGAKSPGFCITHGFLYMGHCPTGGNW